MALAPTGRNLSAARLNKHRYASPTVQFSPDVLPKHTSARSARVRARQYPAVIPAPASMLRTAFSGSVRVGGGHHHGDLSHAGGIVASSRYRLFQPRPGVGRVGANRYHRPDQGLQVSVSAAGGDSLAACRVGAGRYHGHLSQPGPVGRQAADDLLGLGRVGASGSQGYILQGLDPGRCAADGAGVMLGLCQQLPSVVRVELGCAATFMLVSATACKSLLLMARAHCSASASSCPAWSGSIGAAAASAVVGATFRKVP